VAEKVVKLVRGGLAAFGEVRKDVHFGLGDAELGDLALKVEPDEVGRALGRRDQVVFFSGHSRGPGTDAFVVRSPDLSHYRILRRQTIAGCR
jgi:hypothetical protein